MWLISAIDVVGRIALTITASPTQSIYGSTSRRTMLSEACLNATGTTATTMYPLLPSTRYGGTFRTSMSPPGVMSARSVGRHSIARTSCAITLALSTSANIVFSPYSARKRSLACPLMASRTSHFGTMLFLERSGSVILCFVFEYPTSLSLFSRARSYFYRNKPILPFRERSTS